ncbi:hypothetical protein [Chitinophaga parva]|uniref:hypothetical protein n=1 Tax=Chitinophaga parva TaxID=2169414 RepID=UPI00105742BA|nr:hypothetical protein [Chitinophaga parva]
MKSLKSLSSSTLATSGAFAIGILSIFAFKAPEKKMSPKTQTLHTWNSTNVSTRQCVTTICTSTPEPTLCGIVGVFSDNKCTVAESTFIYHRP